jgi:hypothetical protein
MINKHHTNCERKMVFLRYNMSEYTITLLLMILLFTSTHDCYGQTSHPQPLWTKFDEKDSKVNFSGKWKTFDSSLSFKGSLHESNNKDSEVRFSFNGFMARIYGGRDNDMGEAIIYIDDVLKGTIDCYRSKQEYNTLLFQSDSLKDGNHSLKLKVKGTKNPSSKGTRISLDAFSCLAVTTYTLTTVSVDNEPLIDTLLLERLGAKCGIEGGVVVKYKNGYRMITHEITDCEIIRSQQKTLGLYKSDDGKIWERIKEVTPDTGRKQLFIQKPSTRKWGPILYYNEKEGKWNIYVYANGMVVRSVSLTTGYDGIEGPYEDVQVIIKPGKPEDPQPSDPWEGNLIFSWYHYEVSGDTMYAFYGSPGKSGNRVGLARSCNGMTGPWLRVSGLNPVETGAELQTENPVVVKLEDGNYIALSDGGDYGFMKTPRGISAFMSCDGIHWGKVTYTDLWNYSGKWWHTLRTPMCFLIQPDGNYLMYYTAWTKESVVRNGANIFNPGKETLGRAIIKLSIKNAPEGR